MIPVLTRSATVSMPTRYGDFAGISFTVEPNGPTHFALVMGDLASDNVLTRLHSECLTGDVFGSLRCDCGGQLEMSLRTIAEEGQGVVLYMHDHEGRGTGLAGKLAAYRLQEDGLDTVEANLHLGLPIDARDYLVTVAMLRELGVEGVRLLTNNPEKCSALERYGIAVRERIPVELPPNAHNIAYLRTKRDRMGHLITALDDSL